jgi:hypothetical protein
MTVRKLETWIPVTDDTLADLRPFGPIYATRSGVIVWGTVPLDPLVHSLRFIYEHRGEPPDDVPWTPCWECYGGGGICVPCACCDRRGWHWGTRLPYPCERARLEALEVIDE